MIREELLKEIKKLPKGTEVCIGDWRKNSFNAGDEPCGIGIVPEFKVEHHTENVERPFATLSFDNDDYTKEGLPDYGSRIMNYE